MNIKILEVDITTLAVDAIVNAANERMLGGGGVDGAIHRAAGPRLLEACRAVAEVRPGVRCPTDEARITPAFDLPAKFVIHTVGPVWHGGTKDEAKLLAMCYRNCMALAAEKNLRSIAFPAISTGVYAYPPAAAARVAVNAVRAFLADRTDITVTFACFGRSSVEAHERAVADEKAEAPETAAHENAAHENASESI